MRTFLEFLAEQGVMLEARFTCPQCGNSFTGDPNRTPENPKCKQCGKPVKKTETYPHDINKPKDDPDHPRMAEGLWMSDGQGGEPSSGKSVRSALKSGWMKPSNGGGGMAPAGAAPMGGGGLSLPPR